MLECTTIFKALMMILQHYNIQVTEHGFYDAIYPNALLQSGKIMYLVLF